MQGMVAEKRSRGKPRQRHGRKTSQIRLLRWQQQAEWRRTGINLQRHLGSDVLTRICSEKKYSVSVRSSELCIVILPFHLLRGSAGSILDISKYRDTYERSISILDGIAILRYIE